MKTKITLAAILTLLSMSAGAEVYKCNKGGRTNYQSTPCSVDAPDSNKVKVKPPTAEQEAAAKEKLRSIEADNAAYKEKNEKIANKLDTVNTANRAVVDANSLEKEADKPAVGAMPTYVPPAR